MTSGACMRGKLPAFFAMLLYVLLALSCNVEWRYDIDAVPEEKIAGGSESGGAESGQNGTEKKDVKNYDWTIIVYMAADNNLESEGIADLNEMEAASYDCTKTAVLVLFDRSSSYDTSNDNWSDTRLFEVCQDVNGTNKKIISKQIDCPQLGLKKNSQKELNMSDGNVLKNLLVFAQTSYPATRYGLVIWGHGTGWRYCQTVCQQKVPADIRAVAVDDESGTFMSLPELHNAIHTGMNGAKISFLGFDTCFGAELEEIYELRDTAEYFAGSAGTISNSGWNYTKFLSSCDGLHEDGLSLGHSLESQFTDDSQSTFSIINLAKVEKLFDTFESFAKIVSKQITSEAAKDIVVEAMTKECKTYYVSGSASSLFVDVYDVSLVLANKISAVKNESSALQIALKETVCNAQGNGSEGYPLGVFYCTVTNTGSVNKTVPELYVQGNASAEQCQFVRNSKWYVPTGRTSGTLLDKLFFTVY